MIQDFQGRFQTLTGRSKRKGSGKNQEVQIPRQPHRLLTERGEQILVCCAEGESLGKLTGSCAKEGLEVGGGLGKEAWQGE